VGISNNPDKRLLEHNAGKTKSTKGFIPWRIVYKEIVPDRQTAREREKYLKSGCGKEYIKKVLDP
jgi:putative endonuclease